MKSEVRVTSAAASLIHEGQRIEPVRPLKLPLAWRLMQLIRSRGARYQLWLRLTLRKEVTRVAAVDRKRGVITMETVTKWVWQ